jgi:hypothetical protein
MAINVWESDVSTMTVAACSCCRDGIEILLSSGSLYTELLLLMLWQLPSFTPGRLDKICTKQASMGSTHAV